MDAGGGTIDISAYKQRSSDPCIFEEIAPPQCQHVLHSTHEQHLTVFIGAFRGSIFVTRQAKEYLEGPTCTNIFANTYMKIIALLAGSKFIDDIPCITEMFDKTTKLRFVNQDEAQFIKFGGLRDRAPELNIKSGQLKLLG